MNLKTSPTVILSSVYTEDSVIISILDQLYGFKSNQFLNRLLDSAPRCLIIGDVYWDLVPTEIRELIHQVTQVSFEEVQKNLNSMGKYFDYIIQVEEFYQETSPKGSIGWGAKKISEEFRYLSKYCQENNCYYIKMCQVRSNPAQTNGQNINSYSMVGHGVAHAANTIYKVEVEKNISQPTKELLITTIKDLTGMEPKNFRINVPELE